MLTIKKPCSHLVKLHVAFYSLKGNKFKELHKAYGNRVLCSTHLVLTSVGLYTGMCSTHLVLNSLGLYTGMCSTHLVLTIVGLYTGMCSTHLVMNTYNTKPLNKIGVFLLTAERGTLKCM
jgi:hypothetical protein